MRIGLIPQRFDATTSLVRGAEMGRFMLGSTVILLFPRDTVHWERELAAGSPLRMGQRIGLPP